MIYITSTYDSVQLGIVFFSVWLMTEELVIREDRFYEAAGRGDSDKRMINIMPLKLK